MQIRKRKSKRPPRRSPLRPPEHRDTLYFRGLFIRLLPGHDCSEFKVVKVASSPIHKLGLFIEEAVGEGEKIIELIGRRVAAEEVDTLEMQSQEIGIKDCFLFAVDEREVIDCTHTSNAARFANHSCKPNMEAKIIKSRGKNRVMYFSRRAIAKGEELTLGYNFDPEIGSRHRIPCNCGTSICGGFID